MTIGTLDKRVYRNAKRRGVKIYTRRTWGSKHRASYVKRIWTHPVSRVEADTLVQHITVTRDDGLKRVDFFEDMQEVERIGDERFGTGFPYNYGIDMKTGEVGIGMPLRARGAHTLNEYDKAGYSFNQNYVARAFAMIGMPGDIPSEKAIIALANLFAAMMEEKALTVSPDYKPHRFFTNKACPTDAVVDIMPRVLALAHKSCSRKR